MIYFLLFFQIIAGASAPSGQSVFDSKIRWHDESGHELQLEQFKDEELVFGLAYTTCRITCPMVVQQLKEIEKKMDQKLVRGEIFFISIDPEKDTIQRLADYKKKIHIESKRWHFLRANKDETHDFAKILGFDFNTTDEHIWHDRKVLLVDGKGHLRKSLEGFNTSLEGIF